MTNPLPTPGESVSSTSLGSQVVEPLPGSGHPVPSQTSTTTPPAPTPSGEDWKARFDAAQQELESARDSIKLAKMIESDPQATQLLLDHFKGPAPAQAGLAGAKGAGDVTIEKLAEALRLVASQVQLIDFRSRTPDYGTFEGKMREIAQRYPQLALDDIYRLAKAEGVGNGKPTAQAAEGAVKAPSSGGGDLDALAKQVNEATDFESAVRVALQGAARRAGIPGA